jgi:hypothetical protein
LGQRLNSFRIFAGRCDILLQASNHFVLACGAFMSTPGKSQYVAIDRGRLHSLMAQEEQRFVATHPKSAALYERAQKSLLGGVPIELDEKMGWEISGVRGRGAWRAF